MTEFEHEKKSLPEPDKTPVDPLMEARAQAMAELAQLSRPSFPMSNCRQGSPSMRWA